VGDERQGLFVYLNRGKRDFSDPIMLVGRPRVPYSVAIADLNRDGKPDIVVGNQGAPDDKGAVYGLAIADLDGDGWPDIAAARSDAPNAVWFSTIIGAK